MTESSPAGQEGSPRAQAREARHALYRKLILDAAAAVFDHHGVKASRMEQVAEAAGLSLGTVYAVFRGKDEIVDALHEARLREILEASVQASDQPVDPTEALMAGVRAYVEYFVERPDYLRLYVEDGTSWGVRASMAAHPRRSAAWSEGIEHQTEIFRRGMETGLFVSGNPDRMARMMVAMQQVQLADWLEEDMVRDPEDLIAEIERQVRLSFCVDAVRTGVRD